MSILDLFSASPGVRAAKAFAQPIITGATQAFDWTKDQLGSGADDALSALQKYAGQAIDTTKNYGGQAVGAINNALPQQIQALMGGTDKQVGAYQQGIAPWQQLFDQYNPAAETYWGALGAGTPEQNMAAAGKFQASPGYQYSLGQGLEGISRTGQSTGQLGAANMDSATFAQNLADQDYQQWIKNLSPALTGQQTAAEGIQKGYGDIGSAYGTQGANLSDLYGTNAANVAKLLAATGGSIADLQSALGPQSADINTGLASALANAGNTYYNKLGDTKANRVQQQFGARTSANTNTLNGLFGIANLAMAPFTGGATLGSAFGSLGKIGAPQGSDASGLAGGINSLFGGSGYANSTGAFDSMMQGGGFMDNAGNIY